MRIWYTPRHRRHDTTRVMLEGHPYLSAELPARAEIILDATQQAGLGPVVEPTDHGMEPIWAVHDRDMIEYLITAYDQSTIWNGQPTPVFPFTFSVKQGLRRPTSFVGLRGYYVLDWDTPILEGTWEAAYWSVQCALSAADDVLSGRRVAYALCRPPGHHAADDLFGGYCYLNNAAIAARHLQAHGRVAVLDIDYHHGNGTQTIFWRDPDVLYTSIHVHPDQGYPFYWGSEHEIGAGPGRWTNRNWTLSRGADDAAYLTVLERALTEMMDFAPAFLVLSAGLDTAAEDPCGGFVVSETGFAEIGRQIAALNLPTVVVQEGGYGLERLGRDAVALLRPLAGCSQE